MTKPAVLYDYIQVVGYTPMEDIDDYDGIISTDILSTAHGEKPGEEKMIIINIETGEFEKIDIDFRGEFGESRI